MAKNTKNFVTLVCTECKSRNYVIRKGRQSKEKLQINKYCPKCKKHTLHKESK
ncbi:50S ribosomal protein L33 [Mesoaciditoga sp.]